MFCAHCGSLAEPQDRVCRACGAALPVAPMAAPALDKPDQPNQADQVSAVLSPLVVAAAATATPALARDAAASGLESQPATPSLGATPPVPGDPSPRAAAPSPTPLAEKQPDAGGTKAGHAWILNHQAYPPPYPYAYPAPTYYQYAAYPGYSPYGPYAGHPHAPVVYPTYHYAAYYPQIPYYYTPPPAPRAPGETYRLVLAWIVTFGGGFSILGGLLLGAATAVAAARGGPNNLEVLAADGGLTLATLLGGIAGLVYGITAILRRPSPRFGFPSAWIFLGLTVLALGGGVVIWNLSAGPGSALAILPLVLLAGLLPALTILAFTAGRLRFPSTWRHMMLSAAYGAVAATTLAAILELVASPFIVLFLRAIGIQVSGGVDITNYNPSNPGAVLAIFLLISVVAPIVEEGLKPLGAVLVMPRIRGPNEAFLLGLTAGLGFAVVETVTYFGMGEADWVSVAIERLGAGLLHGVGAGMSALGWYYLIRGKGMRLRWLLGFGALLYAIVQHAVFNGSTLLGSLPPIGKFLSQPLPLIRPPLGGDTVVAFILYAIILGVLVVVTWRLRRFSSDPLPPKTAPLAPGMGSPAGRTAQPVQGGAR